MLLMHANDREDIQVAYAGDIVALAGLKDTHHRRHALRAERADHPRADGVPGSGDRGRGRSRRPRPTRRRWASRSIAWRARIRRSASPPTIETGQTIIKGMGELHLEILVDRMKREFKVEANVGAPQVAYREISRRSRSTSTYTHKKQSGGSGQFGRSQGAA